MYPLFQPVRYLLVALLVILSGSLIPFIFSPKYTFFLILFLAFLLSLFLVFEQRHVTFESFLFLLAVCSLLLLLMLIHKDFGKLSEYSGFMGRFLIAFMVTELICRQDFTRIYTRLMVYYSAVSIVMYCIGIAFPSFIYTLPVSYNDAGTGYRHILFYFYQGMDFWNFRNAGMFWEPGAYQVFLGMALIFEVFLLGRRVPRILLLMAAIATTISSVGIVVILVMAGFLLFSSRSLLKYPLLITVVAMVWYFDIIEKVILVKFYGENISGIDRVSGQLADLELFFTKPFLGVGLTEYNDKFKDIAYSFGAIRPTSSNSFTGMLALNGLLYSAIFFFPMFLFFAKTSVGLKEKLLMLVLFIMLLSSQGVMMQLFFLCLSFYSFQHESSVKPIAFISPPSVDCIRN